MESPQTVEQNGALKQLSKDRDNDHLIFQRDNTCEGIIIQIKAVHFPFVVVGQTGCWR
jgi:hypothetical protein